MARDSFTVRGIFRAQYEGDQDLKRADNQTQGLIKSWGRLGRVATVLTASLAAVGLAFSKIVDAIQAAAEAAARTESSFQRLRNNTRLLGDESGETAEALSAQADALQSLTGVSADVIRESQGLLAALGVQRDQLGEATQASLDLAAALGIDLLSAARNVGRTVGGFAGELGEVIPELKELGAEALQAGEGIRFLSEQFAGSAAENAQTYAARIQILEQSLGEVTKSLGEATVQSENLATAQRLTANQALELAENTRAVSALSARLATGWQTLQLLGLKLASGLGSLVDGWLGYSEAVEDAANATDKINAAQQTQVDLADEVEAALKRVVKSEQDLLAVRQAEATLLERLGIRSQEQLADALERVRIEQELLTGLLRDGEITQRQYAQGSAELADTAERLERELRGEAEAVTELSEATETLNQGQAETIENQRELTDEVQRGTRALSEQGAQALRTAAQFDELARSAGRAAAVEAALAGGAETILGGTRILLPGGGSRLVRPPGFTGVNASNPSSRRR